MLSQANKTDITTLEKKRIEFLDLAKGICILLVVWLHVDVDTPRDIYLSAIRMPLFFFLSGMFFKEYDGFLTFLKKKTNKLLIPFVFFYLTTSVLIPIILCHNNTFYAQVYASCNCAKRSSQTDIGWRTR